LPLYAYAHYGLRNSDEAMLVLQAAAMLHGNLVMHGWVLPQDTFITSEVPFFVPAVALHGVAIDLIASVPTGVYLATALLAAFTAARGLRHPRGVLAGGVTALLLAAVPALWGYVALTSGIGHVPAAWAALLAFNLVLGRGRALLRSIAAGLLLALVSLGDPLVLVTGGAPLLGLGAWELLRRRGWQPLVGGALAVAGFELGERALIHLAGVLMVQVPVGIVRTHIRAHAALALANANGLVLPAGDLGVWAVVATAVFWLLVTTALLLAAERGLRLREPAARLDLLLLLAVGFGFAAYVATDRASITLTARYLVPSLILACVAGGRLAAAAYDRRRALALLPAAAALAVAGVRLAGIAEALQSPPAPPAVVAVDRYLLAHGYHRGYGPYWDAAWSTVYTGERLEVRPVMAVGGRVVPYSWLGDSAWFPPSPGTGDAHFLYYRDAGSLAQANAAGDFGVFIAPVEATFGPPDETVHLPGYTVLLWRTDISRGLRWS
jgi:hypothetical protein